MRYGKHVGVCALIGALVGGTPSCESDGSSSRSAQSDGGDDAAVDGGKHLAEAGTHHSMPEAGTKRDAAGPEAGRLDVFDAWREVQKALDASPDNLPARADALVLAKDPQKIFEFVRDEIVTYPPAPDGLDGATDAIRWGTRGTLRGGAGTPREKADLLVELYTRAGFDAQVVGGTADPAKLDGKKLLFRSLERKYAPAITAAELNMNRREHRSATANLAYCRSTAGWSESTASQSLSVAKGSSAAFACSTEGAPTKSSTALR